MREAALLDRGARTGADDNAGHRSHEFLGIAFRRRHIWHEGAVLHETPHRPRVLLAHEVNAQPDLCLLPKIRRLRAREVSEVGPDDLHGLRHRHEHVVHRGPPRHPEIHKQREIPLASPALDVFGEHGTHIFGEVRQLWPRGIVALVEDVVQAVGEPLQAKLDDPFLELAPAELDRVPGRAAVAPPLAQKAVEIVLFGPRPAGRTSRTR